MRREVNNMESSLVNKVLYYDYHEFCRNDGCSGTAQNIIICCCCSICKLLKVHWFWSLLLLDGYTVTQMDDMSIVQSSEPLFHDTWSILYEKVNPAPLQIFFLIYIVSKPDGVVMLVSQPVCNLFWLQNRQSQIQDSRQWWGARNHHHQLINLAIDLALMPFVV